MKYQPIFKLPYSNVFITDLLFKGAYNKLNPIAVIKNGKWELFVEKKLLGDLAEERFLQAIKGINFEEFKRNSLNLANELKTLNINVDAMDKNNFIEFIEKMFDIGGRFMDNYTQTEFFYFSKIENELGDFIKDKFSFEDVLNGKVDISSWPEDKKNLAEYIINIQHLKLELRKVLNEVWMGPNSVLSKILEQLVIRTGREDVVSMTLEEVKDLLNEKKVEDVSERHVYSYITWDNKRK